MSLRERGLSHFGVVQPAFDQRAEAVDLAGAADVDQVHAMRLAGLESHGGAGRDVEPLAIGGLAIESEVLVDLEEVEVRSDLDRAVGGVDHVELDVLAALVERQVAVGVEVLARLELLGGFDRIVDGDELGAVGEGGFDLHHVDHLGHAVHHVLGLEQRAAIRHEFGHRGPLAGAFHAFGADQRDSLRIVELHAAVFALLGQLPRLMQQQLVYLSWSKSHEAPVVVPTYLRSSAIVWRE